MKYVDRKAKHKITIFYHQTLCELYFFSLGNEGFWGGGGRGGWSGKQGVYVFVCEHMCVYVYVCVCGWMCVWVEHKRVWKTVNQFMLLSLWVFFFCWGMWVFGGFFCQGNKECMCLCATTCVRVCVCAGACVFVSRTQERVSVWKTVNQFMHLSLRWADRFVWGVCFLLA